MRDPEAAICLDDTAYTTHAGLLRSQVPLGGGGLLALA